MKVFRNQKEYLGTEINNNIFKKTTLSQIWKIITLMDNIKFSTHVDFLSTSYVLLCIKKYY